MSEAEASGGVDVGDSQPTEEQPPSSQPSQAAAKAPAPDGPQEKKAKAYMEEADKKVKSSQTFFGGMFG